MKTWSNGKLKETDVQGENRQKIEKFLSGEDILLDSKLIKWEILSTISHEIMLNKIELLTDEELNTILRELLDMYENGIELKEELEDVHANIEAKLIEKLGETGKKVHTAISRNEKIITDLKLFSKSELLNISELALQLAKAIMEVAEKYKNSIMPGYTHHQQAMPYTFGSFLMSHFYSLINNVELLQLVYKIIDKSPLGSGAGYGVFLDVDKELTAKLLGFEKPQENALSTINSRGKDEALVAYVCNQIMLDLNKMSEDFILFSTKEFNFIELPAEYCTGSSIMPQKKNPDVLELVKGKTSKTTANLLQIITTMKNLPSGYNRDLQETKAAFMSSIETVKASLIVMANLIKNIKVNEDEMKKKLNGESFATQHALILTQGGIPFKSAYKIIADKLRDGERLEYLETKPDFGNNYKAIFEDNENVTKKMKEDFEEKIKSLINLAKKISNNKK